ncbi:MAG: phosphoenolpyruvate--protein phosphotransferase [Treponema sp.]|nr:phosphoenolpyruvate--protein phosphotransferase [Treponema sp.]
MDILFGTSISSGIGSGKAFVIPEPTQRIIPQTPIAIEQLESEWLRYTCARDSVSAQIKIRLEQINSQGKDADKTQKDIFETYALMLADPVFNGEVEDLLKRELFNVEHILKLKIEEYSNRLRESGNNYLAERGQDITDIFGRVINEMLNLHPFNIEEIPERCVLIAHSLSPGDFSILAEKKIIGIALTQGGASSHIAILARNYSIPAVSAIPKITKKIKNGETVIIDADKSEIIIEPDSTTIDSYVTKIKKQSERGQELLQFRSLPAKTKDGTKFNLYANIGAPQEAERALQEGAEGIGLFRTEFLFMNELNSANASAIRTVTEETQFEAYKRVLETMKGKPVTIRTLDLGGDKLLSLMDAPNIEEKNPLMGLRAIRLSLNYPRLFRTQLRALYRASVFGDLRIMLPLITDASQISQTKAIIKQVCDELESEKIPFKKNVPLGIMIETAAAGICAASLAKQADFFSIGTNDLTQYTIGVDRENTNVSSLYDEFHPAVLFLIKRTVDAAKSEGIPVSICGEMASRTESLSVLAGIGVRSLSMSSNLIPLVKKNLSQTTISEMKSEAKKYWKEL